MALICQQQDVDNCDLSQRSKMGHKERENLRCKTSSVMHFPSISLCCLSQSNLETSHSRKLQSRFPRFIVPNVHTAWNKNHFKPGPFRSTDCSLRPLRSSTKAEAPKITEDRRSGDTFGTWSFSKQENPSNWVPNLDWNLARFLHKERKYKGTEFGTWRTFTKRVHSDRVRKLERFLQKENPSNWFRVRRKAYKEQLRALGCWRVFVHDPYASACSSTTAKKEKKQEQI